MKLPSLTLYFLILLWIAGVACNPECETYTVINAEIEPSLRLAGEDILVRTDPPEFLRDRELYVGKRSNNQVDFELIESEYMPEAGGRVACLAADIVDVGNQNIYVLDADCGGYIPLNTVQVVDQDFVSANPGLFVSPTPPVIIIPPLPIPAPTNLVNTWFSPDDPAYCVWFFPKVDTLKDRNGQDSCYRERTTLLPGDIANNDGTRELRCGGTEADYDHNNPITGFIDKSTGQVNITIDRDAKGLGIEQYLGQIVEPTELPEAYQIGGRCSADGSSRPTTIMVLTSQKTGRKLVLYRQAPADFDESMFCPPK